MGSIVNGERQLKNSYHPSKKKNNSWKSCCYPNHSKGDITYRFLMSILETDSAFNKNFNPSQPCFRSHFKAKKSLIYDLIVVLSNWVVMDWGFLSVNLDYCNALCVEKPLTLQLFFKKDFEFPFSVVLLHINQSMMSFFLWILYHNQIIKLLQDEIENYRLSFQTRSPLESSIEMWYRKKVHKNVPTMYKLLTEFQTFAHLFQKKCLFFRNCYVKFLPFLPLQQLIGYIKVP